MKYTYPEDKPLCESPFHLWCMAQTYEYLASSSRVPLITGFMQANGYTSYDGELVGYTLHGILNSWRLHNNRYPLSELLTPTKNSGGFWLRGESGRWDITPKMRELMEPIGLLNGLSIYFEIVRGNRLLWKYDQILGGGSIATLTDLPEEE